MKNIKISGCFILCLALLSVIDSSGWITLLIFAAVLHELGHVVAIVMCGGSIACFEAGIAGCKITYDMGHSSYAKDIIMAAAGPMANILAIVAAMLLPKGENVYYFIGSCTMLCVLNLLPAPTLDGGRMLFATIAKLRGIEAAEKVMRPLGALLGISVAISFVGIFVASGYNIAVLVSELIIIFALCGKSALQNRRGRLSYKVR